MPYLLDTNALSEPLRRVPNPRFVTRLAAIPAEDLYTSTVCVMELRYGCALQKNIVLWNRITRDVLTQVTILPFNSEEAVRCGELLSALALAGTPIGIEDTQIGATALLHHLIVVTANTKHFDKIPGLRIENWLRD